MRLTQGDYNRETIYEVDPAEVAQDFVTHGAEWIHVVDLDGAKSGRPENLDLLASIIGASDRPIEFGGGVRSLETARTLIDLGVGRVVVGTKLVQDEELAARMFAELGDRVVAGIDARNGMVATIGWTETSEVTAAEMARRVEAAGCRRIILTDIARDGAMRGPNLELLTEVASAVSIPVIASGGVSVLDDVTALTQVQPALEGVIVGKALYEGNLTLPDMIARTH